MDSKAGPSDPIEFALNDLTLIIPTLNRQSTAQRTAEYWSGLGPQVLILDGSPSPWTNDCLSSLAENVNYIHGTFDVFQRLSLVKANVKTDFVCLHGDDELHLPSALAQCVKTLKEHPDLVACIGWAIGFRVEKNGKVSGSEVYAALRGYGLSSPDPLKRISEHMSPYRVPAHTYAVTRSDAYLRALDIVCSNDKFFFAQAEYEIETAIAAQGKTIAIPQLQWLRNTAGSDLRNTSVATNETWKLEDFWLNRSNLADREAFVNGLANGLAEAVGVDAVELAENLTRLFDEEANRRANQRDLSSVPLFSIQGLYRIAIDRLSPKISSRITNGQRAVRHRLSRIRTESLARTAIELEGLGARVEWNELLEATRLLQGFK